MTKPSRNHSRSVGMSLFEMVLAISLFTIAIVAVVELFLSVSARIALHNRRENVLRGAERFVAEFTAALNQATSCAIYPNAAVARGANPLQGNAGDFCVLHLGSGKDLELELTAGKLQITERNGTQNGTYVCAQDVDLEGDFLFKHVDGVMSLQFLANVRPKRLLNANEVARPGEHLETVRFLAGGRAAAFR